MQFNPFDADSLLDPYPAYAELRQHAPVAYCAPIDAWTVAGHDDCVRAFRNTEALSSAPPGGDRDGTRFLLGSDPPVHTQLRRLLTKPFRPSAMRLLEHDVDRICNELFDDLEKAFAETGEADFVRVVASPLPVRVICQLMGVSADRQDDFTRWTAAFVGGLGVGPRDAARAIHEMRAFFGTTIEERTKAPKDDLISVLTTADEPLSADELFMFCMLLLIAGNETTTNLISNMMLVLLGDRDLDERVRGDRGLVPTVAEETLRYDAPVQGVWRIATRDVELGSTTIPDGARVLLLQGSANRDEAAYDQPARFDVDRTDGDHVTFGVGIHYCLGAPLARIETKALLNTMYDRDIRLASAGAGIRLVPAQEAPKRRQTHKPAVRRNPLSRGMTTLPVRRA